MKNTPAPGDSQILELYRQRRALCMAIQQRLLHLVPRKIILACASRIGYDAHRSNQDVRENQMALLADSCLYAWRHAGQSRVEKYLADTAPAAGSPERLMLETMARSLFHVIEITDVRKGVGLQVKDLLRGTSVFLVDINLSNTAARGGVFAARLLRFDEFAMTAGASMRAEDNASKTPEFAAGIARMMPDAPALLQPEREAEFALNTTADWIRSGGAERIVQRFAP